MESKSFNRTSDTFIAPGQTDSRLANLAVGFLFSSWEICKEIEDGYKYGRGKDKGGRFQGKCEETSD